MVNKIKSAFTLAEVLITLVIIGIVAALTISAVINTYVERSTISKVKKLLSTLGQAKKLAETQNGPIEGWDYPVGNAADTAAIFWNYFKPHISLAKNCIYSSDCYSVIATRMAGGIETYSSYHQLVLADGSLLLFRLGGNHGSGKCSVEDTGLQKSCALFWYDVNGEKGPNSFGKDIFIYIMNVDGVYPNPRNDCSKNSEGWGCANYIIKNGNMNYLH